MLGSRCLGSALRDGSSIFADVDYSTIIETNGISSHMCCGINDYNGVHLGYGFAGDDGL